MTKVLEAASWEGRIFSGGWTEGAGEAIEFGACAAAARRPGGRARRLHRAPADVGSRRCTRLGRREPIAEVRPLLVENALRLRLATLVGRTHVVEAALTAAVQIDAAGRTGVAPADTLARPDVGTAAVARDAHQRPGAARRIGDGR